MTLQLYTSPGSIGVASHIALEESGLGYERVVVDFSTGEQLSEEYQRVNPKGRVPALVVDGQVLTETPAILTYVAQVAGAAVLDLPDEPLALAQVHSFNNYLASTVHVAHAHKMRGRRWTDDAQALAAMTAYVPTSMAQCFGLIENELLQGPWVMGERYGICDPYLFALSRWMAGDGVEMADFPKIQAHHAAMLLRPAVQRVLESH